eukprot:SAG22_NODE_5160_length_1074_cov_1.605128_2_plen_23_part_01
MAVAAALRCNNCLRFFELLRGAS